MFGGEIYLSSYLEKVLILGKVEEEKKEDEQQLVIMGALEKSDRDSLPGRKIDNH